MPKGKTKPQAKPARADVVDAMTLIALTNRVDALDEAICPKVAARLAGLERRVGQRPGNNSFGIVGEFEEQLQKLTERVNADDVDKQRVFEVLAQIRTTVLERVQKLETHVKYQQEAYEAVFKRLNSFLTRISSLEELPNRVRRVENAVAPYDSNNSEAVRRVREGIGQCSAPSKADDRGIVSYMITKLKNEMGIEFTEAGMKRIITLIEKV